MANILDYLDWRGDIPFSVSPFNEVDSYILCVLSCPDYTGVAPANGLEPVGKLIGDYFAAGGEEKNLGFFASPCLEPMLRRLPETERFSPVLAGDYVNLVDTQRGEQFSALTSRLPDGTRLVAFRGTDDTILAWKEDFLLGVQDVIPAQRDAAAYLMREAEKEPGPLVVGGPSKGGNLAVYAAMTVSPEVQDRIVAVYNHDGPGFHQDVLGRPEYLRIRPRVHTIVPQHAIIGKLLYHESDFTIVRSGASGTAAHDGFHWETLGTRFVRCEDFSLASKAFESALVEVESRMDMDERRRTLDALFGLLTSTGAVTLTDLTEHRLRQAVSMARELRQAPEVTRFARILLTLTAREALSGARQYLPNGRHFRKKPEE